MSPTRTGPSRLVEAIVPKKRRGVELALLVMALCIGVGQLRTRGPRYRGQGAQPTSSSTAVAWSLLALACHLVVRFRAPYADPVILPCVVALNGIGLAMIHRIDVARMAQDPGSHTYATQQLIWTALSVSGSSSR